MKLYELTCEITCRRPPRWQTYARYALNHSGQELTLAAGTWLLEPTSESDHACCWLVDGTAVSPLLEGMAKLVDRPKTLRVMASYRSLPGTYRTGGLGRAHGTHRQFRPLSAHQVPTVWGRNFTSVDFAQAWRHTRNTNFTVRHTAGDPGFVVDFTWCITRSGTLNTSCLARPTFV